MNRPHKVKHRTGSATTINPDHVWMHRLIVAGVIATLGAAIAVSWAGLSAVGEWQGLGELRWLTPIMIDVPLVVLTLARGALRKRGIRARGLLVGIVALTIYSSGANLLHTLAVASDLTSVSTWVGAVTNALAPWLIFAMTEVLWLVVTRPIRAPRRATRARAKAAPKRATRPVVVQPALSVFDGVPA